MIGLMKGTLNWRARGLIHRIEPYIQDEDRVLDIGCGTGHNAERLKQVRAVEVQGLDVVDLSVVGPKPRLYDGSKIPFASKSFDVSVLIYMLHYVAEPTAFLKEVKRVSRKRILVVHTVSLGTLGERMHRANEWLFGRGAFQVAQACGLVGSVPCSLESRHDFSPQDILRHGHEAGLEPVSTRLELYGGLLPLGRLTCVFSVGRGD